jgi:hypothetical protein
MTSIPLADDAAPAQAGPPAADRAGARQARLAASVARLRRRSSGIEIDRVLLVAGSILLPSGLIVVLLGWYGASHTSYDFEQTPYLISGGMLGAAMTVAGGFLYFGYWLTRLVNEGRRQRIELSELLVRLDNRMAVLEAAATGTLPSSAGRAVNGSAPGSALVATPTGTLVHRADCPLVAGKSDLRPVDDAAAAGQRGCKVCQPFEDPAFDAAAQG